MFPRLNVRDAERGGPRAPPRNKMALYEQLSVPRFGTGSGAPAQLPVAASSSQGGGRKSNAFSPFNTDHSPAQSAEIVPPHTSNAKILRSTRMELVRRSVGHANQRSSNAALSVAPYRLHGFSSTTRACNEKIDGDDDFKVPTFAHSDINHLNKDKLAMETRSTPRHGNSPQKINSATPGSSFRYPKSLEQASAIPKSRKHERNYNEHMSKETTVLKSVSHSETEDELEVDSLKVSLDQEQTSTRNVVEKPFQGNTKVCLQYSGNGAMNEPVCVNAINAIENGDSILVQNRLYSQESSRNSHRNLKMTDDYTCRSYNKVGGAMELKNADGNDEVLESSMAGSISVLEISPDDIVGQIGPKQFWKARKAIVNQQRVFAVQVFELHRLIKVQKLIAASPHLLLEEESQYLSPEKTTDENLLPEPSAKPRPQKLIAASPHLLLEEESQYLSPEKTADENLLPEPSAKPRPQTAKQTVVFQKLTESTGCQANTSVARPPPCDDNPSKRLHQLPRKEPSSVSPPQPIPVTPENKQTGWCYPSANHWLVPVMSPSEGLIYKPYTGPCPPASGFIASAHGGSIPMSLPPVAYGASLSHHQTVVPDAPSYFPMPYGLPFVDRNASASVEKANLMRHGLPFVNHDATVSVEQANPNPIFRPRPIMQIEQGSRSSCNMVVPRGEAFSNCPLKVNRSKESELQGSTASSPCERAPEGMVVLTSISMPVAVKGSAAPSPSHGGHHRNRVIKVVPHNKRSATESVARIFRSIQEERQQHEL